MAKIKFASYIKSVHGRVGNIIHYNVNGNQYARSFSIPRNPRTVAQQVNRATFAEAVKLWQELPLKKKSEYNRMAAGKSLSGYNIFISMKLKGITPAILKQVLRGQVKESLISAPYMIKGTSVSYSLLYAVNTPSLPREAIPGSPLLKKPPGNESLAA